MSAVVSEMLIRIAADTAQLRSEMNEAKRAVGDGFDGIRNSANSLRSTLVGLFSGIAIGALAKQFIDLSDSMALLDARLKNTVGTGEDFVRAQQEIYRIAQANNIGLQEAATLYTKLNEPVKRLGGTTKETGAIVDAFAMSLRLGGASTAEASAATLQFAQAMASGKLSGDEFRSLAEASPRFMKALADGMGAPIESLKNLGSEGKLTADVVGNALIKSLEQLQAESANLPDTVGGAFTRLKNEVALAAVELNRATGATGGLVSIVATLAEWVRLISGAFSGFADATKDVNLQIDLAAIAIKVLGTTLETVIIIGAEVAFTIRGIAKTFADVAEMASAFASGGLDALSASFKRIKAENEAYRDAHDKFTASVAGATDRVLQQRDALKNHSLSSAENANEMDRLRSKSGALRDGYVALKSSTTEVTEEQKKALETYEKLTNSIQEKTALMAAEDQAQGKLTDAQKTALKVMLDIQNGTLKLTDAQKKNVAALLEQMLATEKSAAENKDAAKAAADHEKAVRDLERAQWAEVDALRKSVESLEDQNERLRIGERAYTEKTVATIRQEAAERRNLAAVLGGNAALEEQAALLERRATALQEEQMLKAAKATAEEWKKTADTIGNNITEALLRGFESGKSFAQNLRDTLVNMFKSLVLRPVIQAVINPVAQGITGMLGIPGMANASGGGGGLLGNAGGLMGAIGSFGSFGATGFMNSIMGGAGMMGNLSSGMGAAGALLQGGNIAGGLGMGLGAIAPYAAVAYGLYALSQQFKGETRSGAQYGFKFDGIDLYNNRSGQLLANAGLGVNKLEGPSGGELAGQQTRQAITATVQSIQDTLKGLGSTATLIGFQAGLETSDKGRGGVFAGGMLSTGATFGESGRGSNYAGTLFESNSQQGGNGEEVLRNFALDLQQVTIQALQAATDIPQSIKSMLEGVDAESLTMDAATSLVATIQMTVASVNSLRDAVAMMPMANLANLSFDAAKGLIDLAGGLDNLMGQLRTYIEEFYSPEERAGMQAQQFASALESVGLTSTDLATRQDFRALLESRDVNTQQGREQLAVLLQMAPTFASLADFMAESNQTLQELIEASPQVAVLESILPETQTTAQATLTVAESVQQGNTLLENINTSITNGNAAVVGAVGGLSSAVQTANATANAALAAANAAAAAATSAASTAASAADQISLVQSNPNWNYQGD
jgi:tape measure domain-containing protein